jgi:hypothetical protein
VSRYSMRLSNFQLMILYFANLQLASTVNFPNLAEGIKTNCDDPYDIVNKIPTSRGLNYD